VTKPRDDEKLAKVARVLREGHDRLVEYVHATQEVTWVLAVRAAMHGDLGPARQKYREGKVPPPRARVALEKAVARLSKGRAPKGQPPAYRGPLFKRERRRTPLLRAVKKYEQLRGLELDSETRLELAVEWVNEKPLQRPPKLVQERCCGRVAVSQLRNEIIKGKARRKIRD
jgi:hypothetical protein